MVFGIILAAIAVVVGGLSYKSARDAQKQAKKAAEAMAGVLVNKESNIEAIPVIYGTRRVGGTRVFVHAEGGEKNEYLYIALVLCEGEVHSITDIEIDDKPITDARFQGLYSVQTFTGSDTQAASTLLSATGKWSTNHKLSGIAYIALRLKWDEDAFSGIPDITAIVKGKLVYDPRTSSTGWSDNAALCIRDYLTNARYGKGLSVSQIDDTAFGDAADDIEAFTVTEYSGGSSGVQLFKCNAVIDTDDAVFQNMEKMLLGCKGFLPYQDGKYSLYVDQSSASVMTLTENEILDGISIQSEKKEDKFNRIICKFPNPETKWQPDQAIWPDPGSSEETAFLADDDEVLVDEIDLETITSWYAARDFARIFCLRSRNALRVAVSATSEAMNLRVGDVVSITHSTPGWSAKPFQVESVTLKYDGTVDLQCVEYDSTIYAYDPASEQQTYDDTDLPDPFDVDAPTVFGATPGAEVLPDGSINSFVDLAWTASDDAFVSYYEVIVVGNDTGFTNQNFYEETSNSSVRVNGLTSGLDYTAKIKAVNSLGVRSGEVSVDFTAVGDTVAPGNPTSVTAQGGLRKVDIFWANPTDKDLAYVEIKRASNSTEANALSIGRSAGTSYTDSRPGGVANYWYWVRAVDTSGNKSVSSDTAGWVAASDNPATTLQLASGDFAEGIVEVDYLSGDIVDNQYSVAMIANPDDANQIEAHGFGLIGDYDPTDTNTFTSQFIVNANKFAIGTPQVGGSTAFIPFVVYTTATSVTLPDGTSRTFDPGVYMSFASIGELVANQITAGYFNLANEDGMHIRQGKTSPSTSGNGFWIGNESNGAGGQNAKFYIGTSSNYMYFDASESRPLVSSGLRVLDSAGDVLLDAGGAGIAQEGGSIIRNGAFRDLGKTAPVYLTNTANTEIIDGWETADSSNGGANNNTSYWGTGGVFQLKDDHTIRTIKGFPVEYGETLYLAVINFTPSGGDREWSIQVQFFDESNDYISGTQVSLDYDSALWDDAPSPGARKLSQAVISVPNDTDIRTCRVRIRGGAGTDTSDYVNIWNVYLGRSPSKITARSASTYIADLSVDTLQINNNAITVPDAEDFAAPAGTTNDPVIIIGANSSAWTECVRMTVDWGSGYANIDRILMYGRQRFEGLKGSRHLDGMSETIFMRLNRINASGNATSPRGQVWQSIDRPGRGVQYSSFAEFPAPIAQTEQYIIEAYASFSGTASQGYWTREQAGIVLQGSKK